MGGWQGGKRAAVIILAEPTSQAGSQVQAIRISFFAKRRLISACIWLAGWPAAWLAGWLAGRLAGWPPQWLP